jgi:FkbM family methyltransferase
MSATRAAAATATDIACRTVGRRTVIRAARYILRRARLDYPNDPAVNGEWSLQAWALRGLAQGEQVHVADVGANVGRWSRSLLLAVAETGRGLDLRLHAFEPETRAFALLGEALSGVPASLNLMALSDRRGTRPLHVAAPAAGVNSLHPAPGVALAQREVRTETLDWYAAERGIDRFGLVKIDTEGHDLAVLRGARELLAGHRVSIVQFEYNHRWVYSRSYLRDAFEFLAELGYRVGKLTPRGVEFYPGWEAELETFVEGNYVACEPAVAACLPAVPWWKTGAAG